MTDLHIPGAVLDEDLNCDAFKSAQGDFSMLSRHDARVAILAIKADEERAMARTPR